MYSQLLAPRFRKDVFQYRNDTHHAVFLVALQTFKINPTSQGRDAYCSKIRKVQFTLLPKSPGTQYARSPQELNVISCLWIYISLPHKQLTSRRKLLLVKKQTTSFSLASKNTTFSIQFQKDIFLPCRVDCLRGM